MSPVKKNLEERSSRAPALPSHSSWQKNITTQSLRSSRPSILPIQARGRPWKPLARTICPPSVPPSLKKLPMLWKTTLKIQKELPGTVQNFRQSLHSCAEHDNVVRYLLQFSLNKNELMRSNGRVLGNRKEWMWVSMPRGKTPGYCRATTFYMAHHYMRTILTVRLYNKIDHFTKIALSFPRSRRRAMTLPPRQRLLFYTVSPPSPSVSHARPLPSVVW
jgi:hypothetical protein